MEEEEEEAALPDFGIENFVEEARPADKDDFEDGTSFEVIWNAVTEPGEDVAMGLLLLLL